MVDTALPAVASGDHRLIRSLTWKDAFWVTSGVPALVLFTIGPVAATAGTTSVLVFAASILIGFVQTFTYGEIASLFPHKSGGASVYGAIAWVRYSKLLAPISVWCNWFAWSPVLAIGVSLGAGYILSILFPADSVVNTWQLTLLNLGWIKPGLSLRLNSTAVLGFILMIIVFAIQHRGMLSAARLQRIIAVSALLPLITIGIVPLVTGDMPLSHFIPFVPLTHDASGAPVNGSWNAQGITVMAGSMLMAAWSTYGFETAVCYTREFKDPSKDTFKALISSGLFCLVIFTLVPLAFQGALGLTGMLDPAIYSGMGVARAMAEIIHVSGMMVNVIVAMLVCSLILSIMTAMAGSSRTLYQGAVDGWLPRYLNHVNAHGAPTRAMWTDLGFNLILLMLSDIVFVLAASNVGYIIFIFMNLNSGWIHRIDRPHWERPFRAPNWLLGAGTFLAYVNLIFLGMGADIWGAGTLLTGLAFASLIIPVFVFRHYIQDRGHFPAAMKDDMHLGDEGGVSTRAGILPYLALAAGVLVVTVAHWAAVY
jgi:amino acid transporter